MRHRSTKERRVERHEFVYMYRAEIAALWALDSRNPAVEDFVERIARPLLTYKATTYYVDIYLTLRRDYMKVFKIKNW
jgi:hypothetical protein